MRVQKRAEANLRLHTDELQLFLSSPVHPPPCQQATHSSLYLDCSFLLCKHLQHMRSSCYADLVLARSMLSSCTELDMQGLFQLLFQACLQSLNC